MRTKAIILSPRAIEYFWTLVEKERIPRVIGFTPCWMWKGGTDKLGYGLYGESKKSSYRAHRISFTFIKGRIPRGLVLDHLCCIHGCVNPEHLEPVTNKINRKRGSLFPRESRHARLVLLNKDKFPNAICATCDRPYRRLYPTQKYCYDCKPHKERAAKPTKRMLAHLETLKIEKAS